MIVWKINKLEQITIMFLISSEITLSKIEDHSVSKNKKYALDIDCPI
jgi:hypothetical protein